MTACEINPLSQNIHHADYVNGIATRAARPRKLALIGTGESLIRDRSPASPGLRIARMAEDVSGERAHPLLPSALNALVMDFLRPQGFFELREFNDAMALPLVIAVSGWTYSSTYLHSVDPNLAGETITTEESSGVLAGRLHEQPYALWLDRRLHTFLTLRLSDWPIAKDGARIFRPREAEMRAIRDKRAVLNHGRRSGPSAIEHRIRMADFDYGRQVIDEMVQQELGKWTEDGVGVSDIRIQIVRFIPNGLARPPASFSASKLSVCLRRGDLAALQLFATDSSASAYCRTNPGMHELLYAYAHDLRP